MIPKNPLEKTIIESPQFEALSQIQITRIDKILETIDTLGDNPGLKEDLRLIALTHEMPSGDFGLKPHLSTIVRLLGVPREAHRDLKKNPKKAEKKIFELFVQMDTNVGVFFHFYWCWNKVRYKSNAEVLWFLDMLKKYKTP